ncbi:hypothetical protein RvY_00358 [Ramazzottius varieornatus]|uniref:Protein kinase domain-containing protein n=1 Tax=Ramazzottius varieornatus TaxID=947166 RepID=A0A1D1UMZ0_RAMVA|nr:hypothetical protein RvY_00358 [Ramazzottius varieornatus]
MAPEVVRGEFVKTAADTDANSAANTAANTIAKAYKADVWSFGVIMYACLAGLLDLNNLLTVKADAGVFPRSDLEKYHTNLTQRVGALPKTASFILRMTLQSILKIRDDERLDLNELLDVVDLHNVSRLPKTPTVQSSGTITAAQADEQGSPLPAPTTAPGATSDPLPSQTEPSKSEKNAENKKSVLSIFKRLNSTTQAKNTGSPPATEKSASSDTSLADPSPSQTESSKSQKNSDDVKPVVDALITLNRLNPLKKYSGVNALKELGRSKKVKGSVKVLNALPQHDREAEQPPASPPSIPYALEQQPRPCNINTDQYQEVARLLVVGSTEPGIQQCGITAFGHGGVYVVTTSSREQQVVYQGTLRVPSVGTGQWSSEYYTNLLEPFTEVYAEYVAALCQTESVSKNCLITAINEAVDISDQIRDSMNETIGSTDDETTQ